MMPRSWTMALAVAGALLCAGTAFAQVEHAQRTALDVAIRRAQVRAALCAQPQTARTMPRAHAAQVEALVPSSPPVGTAGPVEVGDCAGAQSWWPLGR